MSLDDHWVIVYNRNILKGGGEVKKSALLIALGLAAVRTTGDGAWYFLPALVGLAMILGGVRLYEKNR